MRGRFAFVAAILAIVAGLVWLGAWQLDRAVWKTDLLARIERAETAAPVSVASLDAVPDLAPVRLTGQALGPARAMHAVEDGTLGHRLVFAFRSTAGTVLLDAGFVPVPVGDAGTVDAPVGDLTVEGYLLDPPRSGPFVPDNDAVRNVWHRWDMPALSAALGLDPPAEKVLRARGALPGLGVSPIVSAGLPRPHNRHLGYAWTWFGLALTVLGMLAAWLWMGRAARA